MRGARAVISIITATPALSAGVRTGGPVAALAFPIGPAPVAYRAVAPLATPITPGDSVLISERWS